MRAKESSLLLGNYQSQFAAGYDFRQCVVCWFRRFVIFGWGVVFFFFFFFLLGRSTIWNPSALFCAASGCHAHNHESSQADRSQDANPGEHESHCVDWGGGEGGGSIVSHFVLQIRKLIEELGDKRLLDRLRSWSQECSPPPQNVVCCTPPCSLVVSTTTTVVFRFLSVVGTGNYGGHIQRKRGRWCWRIIVISSPQAHGRAMASDAIHEAW